MPLAIDILHDILTDSVFDEDELTREKHVILQEIGAANDTPDDVVYDKFTEAAFRDQTIGRPILGTPETVKSFTPAQIRAYLARHYTGDRIVVVAAGAVDHDIFVKLVDERFGQSIKPTGTLLREITAANYTGGDYRETRDLMDAQVLIGFEGRAYQVRDFYCSQLLANILGGGMSSRLFQEVREKRGLLLFGLCLPLGLFGLGSVRRSRRHRRRGSGRTDPGHLVGTGQGRRWRRRAGNQPLAGAGPLGPADGAGKPRRARQPDRPADAAVRPAGQQ